MHHSLKVVPLLFLLIACGEKEAEAPPPKPVVPLTLQKDGGLDGQTISGVVQPKDTASVSFEVSGKVEKVFYELGERFKKGAVLASLDDRIFQLEVNQRKSQLSEAKARLAEAQNDYNRLKKLNQSGAIADAELDVARAQFISARDQVEIAKAQLGIAQENLDDTRIIAPYDGTVDARYIEPAQRVSPQNVAFDIEGEGALEVSALVAEDDVNQLNIGDTVNMTFSALEEETYQATISEIGSQARSGNAFPVVMTLADTPETLKSGMTASVRLPVTRQSATGEGYRVPVGAFAAGQGQNYYVMQILKHEAEHYSVKKLPATILNMDKQHARLQIELDEGDRIVRTGIVFLQDGQKVLPLSDARTRYNP